MLNRSLATFMNAMTGPNLKELDFMQEGWRLEHTDLNDVKSEIVVKGVVYNEMKGVFSENDNILGQKLQNLILPDHTYGVVSGGDPIEIPNLTWDDLKKIP
ncbi:hypothetical protein NQ317_011401 [Molorchus minor]|uniref:Uncharacterized protein n=1 Tax=Molorchus minor TaxID=1323400 RepID=A0ABQ9IXM6_9CUCU|nr:hypothetical protein NQ317_011401 [Molorchus minor]